MSSSSKLNVLVKGLMSGSKSGGGGGSGAPSGAASPHLDAAAAVAAASAGAGTEGGAAARSSPLAIAAALRRASTGQGSVSSPHAGSPALEPGSGSLRRLADWMKLGSGGGSGGSGRWTPSALSAANRDVDCCANSDDNSSSLPALVDGDGGRPFLPCAALEDDGNSGALAEAHALLERRSPAAGAADGAAGGRPDQHLLGVVEALVAEHRSALLERQRLRSELGATAEALAGARVAEDRLQAAEQLR